MLRKIGKVIRTKMNLYTLSELNSEVRKIKEIYERKLSQQELENESYIKDLQLNYVAQIEELKKDYKDLQKLNIKDKHDLQERIEMLNAKNDAMVNEIGLKNEEIASLNKEIDNLKEEMSHMIKYTELEPMKPKFTGTMNLGSRNTLRSRIARNSAMEVD